MIVPCGIKLATAIVTILDTAAGVEVVGAGWMPATATRPLIQEDPCLLWFDHHGAAHGFERDAGQYDFLAWIAVQGARFEDRWTREFCPNAERVVSQDFGVLERKAWDRTLELLASNQRAIAKAPLWNAAEELYGTADLLVHTDWLYALFPHLRPNYDEPPHYVVLDLKFTTKLDSSEKKLDLAIARAQVRVYSYILGCLQGFMPQRAFIVTRDRIADPLPVSIDAERGKELCAEIAAMRDVHREIKVGGALYLPWQHEIVRPNFCNEMDSPWHGAKKRVAEEYWDGKPIELAPRVGKAQAKALAELGYSSLRDLLSKDPDDIPLAQVKGLGGAYLERTSAVLRANREGKAPTIPPSFVPPRHELELFVDYEYFTNLNCDFENDWPTLAGTSICFMVGLGWEENGEWRFLSFAALCEDKESENRMFEAFLAQLGAMGAFDPDKSCRLYHWTSAEVTQSRKASEEHGLPMLANLPWEDLQKTFYQVPIGLPGCWDFGLKSVAKALAKLSPEHAVEWPDDLGAGLAAMVAGWDAYRQSAPHESSAMLTLTKYLEIDVKAMWQVLKWLRMVAAEPAIID